MLFSHFSHIPLLRGIYETIVTLTSR